jgi:hypothetical protein
MDKLRRYFLLAGSVLTHYAYAQQDSTAVRDSITIAVNDSTVFVPDSAIVQLDSLPEVTDSAIADIPEKQLYALTVEHTWDHDGYVPDVLVTGYNPQIHLWMWLPPEEKNNTWLEFPPVIKFTIFDSIRRGDSIGICFADVHPNNLSTSDPNEKPETPDQPLIPETPWYQAILPSVLRIRKKT